MFVFSSPSFFNNLFSLLLSLLFLPSSSPYFLKYILFNTFYILKDKEPKGIIPLENIQVKEIPSDKSRPHCFELYPSGTSDIIKACKVDSDGKVVEGE